MSLLHCCFICVRVRVRVRVHARVRVRVRVRVVNCAFRTLVLGLLSCDSKKLNMQYSTTAPPLLRVCGCFERQRRTMG